MRSVSYEESRELLNGFLGKQVEVDLSFPALSANTYKCFAWKDSADELKFYDRECEFPQGLIITRKDIKEIFYTEGKSIYSSVFTIILDELRIDMCVSEEPVKCCICDKVINVPIETNWKISGYGNYGSKFDGDQLDLDLCDDCLYGFLYGKESKVLH